MFAAAEAQTPSRSSVRERLVVEVARAVVAVRLEQVDERERVDQVAVPEHQVLVELRPELPVEVDVKSLPCQSACATACAKYQVRHLLVPDLRVHARPCRRARASRRTRARGRRSAAGCRRAARSASARPRSAARSPVDTYARKSSPRDTRPARAASLRELPPLAPRQNAYVRRPARARSRLRMTFAARSAHRAVVDRRPAVLEDRVPNRFVTSSARQPDPAAPQAPRSAVRSARRTGSVVVVEEPHAQRASGTSTRSIGAVAEPNGYDAGHPTVQPTRKRERGQHQVPEAPGVDLQRHAGVRRLAQAPGEVHDRRAARPAPVGLDGDERVDAAHQRRVDQQRDGARVVDRRRELAVHALVGAAEERHPALDRARRLAGQRPHALERPRSSPAPDG